MFLSKERKTGGEGLTDRGLQVSPRRSCVSCVISQSVTALPATTACCNLFLVTDTIFLYLEEGTWTFIVSLQRIYYLIETTLNNMLSLKATKADIGDRFAAIRHQESVVYTCQDYLSSEFQARQAKEVANDSSDSSECQFTSGLSSGSLTSSSSRTGINECWREKICEWSYQVIDHFDFNREIVAISLSYLDRYLSTRPVNRKIFQLAAMTSLYLAIKLYEPSNLRMSSFIELSRGYFSTEHIVAMEEAILRYVAKHSYFLKAYRRNKNFFNYELQLLT